jgi:hypothetical protein
MSAEFNVVSLWNDMKLIISMALATAALLSGCANTLNRATSENYSETCSIAEGNGQLEVAEQACYRALINVDGGNLGPELKSVKLYSLGQIKRQLAKFVEAEALFKESLAIEEKLTGKTSVKVGRRLVELSVSLAAQEKWSEGAQYLESLLPIADQLTGKDRE